MRARALLLKVSLMGGVPEGEGARASVVRIPKKMSCFLFLVPVFLPSDAPATEVR